MFKISDVKKIQRLGLYKPISCPLSFLAHRITFSQKARLRAYTPNSAIYFCISHTNFKLYFKEPVETAHCRYNLLLYSTAYNFCYSASAKIHGVSFSSPVTNRKYARATLTTHHTHTHTHTLQHVFNTHVHTWELKTQKMKLKIQASVVKHDHEWVFESK
jgi:hypothetical protein